MEDGAIQIYIYSIFISYSPSETFVVLPINLLGAMMARLNNKSRIATFSSSRQFLFDYKVVNSTLDNLLVSGGEIFFDFCKQRCQKVAAKPRSSFW